MDMFILAEITSKWDFSGAWCLASILFLIIALIAYCFGPVSGSCTCLVFFVIAIFATGDAGDYGSGMSCTPNPAMITNKSQNKWIDRYTYDINHPKCIFLIVEDSANYPIGNYSLFIPAHEMMIVDGTYRMKPDGRKIVDDDYYLYDATIDPLNAPVEVGGSGIPQWLWHPASPIVVFGLAGLPALLGGMVIASKIRG
jgi:hypothetical protein